MGFGSGNTGLGPVSCCCRQAPGRPTLGKAEGNGPGGTSAGHSPGSSGDECLVVQGRLDTTFTIPVSSPFREVTRVTILVPTSKVRKQKLEEIEELTQVLEVASHGCVLGLLTPCSAQPFPSPITHCDLLVTGVCRACCQSQLLSLSPEPHARAGAWAGARLCVG